MKESKNSKVKPPSTVPSTLRPRTTSAIVMFLILIPLPLGRSSSLSLRQLPRSLHSPKTQLSPLALNHPHPSIICQPPPSPLAPSTAFFSYPRTHHPSHYHLPPSTSRERSESFLPLLSAVTIADRLSQSPSIASSIAFNHPVILARSATPKEDHATPDPLTSFRRLQEACL